ncbi:hrp65 protein-like [Topomyia yanbarensis]|uniref:hrp65 protein-like n=1 Tax=Topomyia yanbarensis TaxID=2498891 RepID=UPI00273CEF66|nr:hrp65 protein-like [Topomyia yanbarensis]
MEVAKPEVNGNPLPQRQPNNAGPQQKGGPGNQNQGGGPGNQNKGGGPGNQNQGGGPGNQNQGGGGPGNQNQGGGGPGNQNQGGGGPGGNQNRGGPGNQNQGGQGNQNQGGNQQRNRGQNQNRGGGNQQNQRGGFQNRFNNRNQQGGGGGFGNRQNNPDGGNDGNNQQQNRQGGQGNRGGNRNRNSQGGDGDQSFDRRRSGPGEQYFINERLRMLQGPLLDLPPIESETPKFAGRNRLYIGNLTNDVTEEELIELFKPYGDITEVFMNKDKNYAFVRVDYFSNAEKAKRELDGTSRKNRILRVRFAPNATALRVRNLTPFVSNELLYKAFEVFGPLERASVQIDERGKSTGEGIVEFKIKPCAMAALRFCTEQCYMLTSSLRPVIVEPYTYQDDTDGLPEKSLNKKIPDFMQARQLGPRFAEMGSFEHEYGQRWKHMHELFKQKAEALKREMIMEEEKLEAQMEFGRYEHETEQLREQLRMREQDRDRQKAEWEMKQRQAEEAKARMELQMKLNVEQMQNRMKRSNDDLNRRQQENNMFMQNKALGGGGDPVIIDGGNDAGVNPTGNKMGGMEVRDYEHGQNRQSLFNNEEGGGGGDGDQQQNQQGGGAGGPQNAGNAFGMGNRNWMNNNNRNSDDFQSKRRRF